MTRLTKQRIALMAAPVGMQPGGYIARAYAGMDHPHTPFVDLSVDRKDGWRIELRWPCPEPVQDAGGNPARFVDGCAVMTGEVRDAPWMTMGAPGQGVAGLVWHADQGEIAPFRAEGLSTVETTSWEGTRDVDARWKDGFWHVVLELSHWPQLDTVRQLGLAVWRGAEGERGGLKAVSREWIRIPEDVRGR